MTKFPNTFEICIFKARYPDNSFCFHANNAVWINNEEKRRKKFNLEPVTHQECLDVDVCLAPEKTLLDFIKSLMKVLGEKYPYALNGDGFRISFKDVEKKIHYIETSRAEESGFKWEIFEPLSDKEIEQLFKIVTENF